jgi:hypothetical protein
VFNTPVELEIAAVVPPLRGADFMHADIQQYLEAMRKHGYDENTIVVRRTETTYTRRDTANWGIIKRVWRYKETSIPAYVPYEVLWFGNGEVTKEWGEPLFVVHAALSYEQMNTLFASQPEPKAV